MYEKSGIVCLATALVDANGTCPCNNSSCTKCFGDYLISSQIFHAHISMMSQEKRFDLRYSTTFWKHYVY